MKILRYVVMAVLFIGLSNVARAFQTTVLDPPSSDSPFFIIQPGDPFSFGFADCYVPLDGVVYTGCALGFNDSNQYLTNFQLTFDAAPVLNDAPADCSSNAFSDTTCGPPVDGVYTLFFEDGCGSSTCGIDPYSFVVILENAVPGSQFPDVAGIANTPEPGTLWLALSGLGSAGYLVRRRKKQLRL